MPGWRNRRKGLKIPGRSVCPVHHVIARELLDVGSILYHIHNLPRRTLIKFANENKVLEEIKGLLRFREE